METDLDWFSKRTSRLLAIAASACGRPLSTLLSHTHQTAAALSREAAPRLLTPAARLLCHWREADALSQPAPAGQARPAGPSAPLPEGGPRGLKGDRLIATALRRLRTGMDLASPSAALNLAVTALHLGAGLEQVAVLAYRAAEHEVFTVSSVDGLQAPALRRFRITMREAPLFARLLQRRACLRLDDDNRTRIWPLLPDKFQAIASDQGFLLMAVGTRSRPIALIYADNRPSASPTTARQGTLFRLVCQALSECLDLLAVRSSVG